MNKVSFDFVGLDDLRIGMFVDLDLGWMAHPFASNSFKITSQRQIDILKGLGVARIRTVPSESDSGEALPGAAAALPDATVVAAMQAADRQLQQARQQRLELRAAQQQSLAACERRFTESAQQYHQAMQLLHSKPQEAGQLSQQMVQGLLSEMQQQQGDTAIRLLTEAAGDKLAMHPVNVTVLSLLLGQAMGLDAAA
ncbi:MAG: DUF3391 domain-containing protein, partial [Rhodoferax sp.]|nr:DUF3391 domain-containing protein [Rhodoferax sp.]